MCGGGTGLCSSDGDNGESMECTEDLDSCYYYIASKIYTNENCNLVLN